jgi:hypothetical protein
MSIWKNISLFFFKSILNYILLQILIKKLVLNLPFLMIGRFFLLFIWTMQFRQRYKIITHIVKYDTYIYYDKYDTKHVKVVI